MQNILIHGLGQDETSWNTIAQELENHNIQVETPNLYKMLENRPPDYDNLFHTFADTLNKIEGKLNLCGLSLGGVLALDYTKKFPDKVNSIILIGTPYKIPKMLFKIQGIIFRLMPKKTFEKMHFPKTQFINLVNSMKTIDIPHNLDKIACKTLVLCGIKDNVNKKSAILLKQNIKGSSLKIIDKASHEINIDNPKALFTILLEFWKEFQSKK